MLLAILVILILGIVSLLWFAWSISYDVKRFQEHNSKSNVEAAKQVAVLSTQAREAMQLVVENQTALDSHLDAVTRESNLHNSFVDLQLQKLQALVNSDMMAARRDELIRTKELKVALERIVTLTTLSRQQPDVRYITAIESATSRIDELETILGIRSYTPS